MLELWKPLLILKDKNNPVIFDEVGNKFKDNPINSHINPNVDNNHPFIIFYDDQEDCYYYLKARGAWDYAKDKYKRKFNNYELLVWETAEGLFKKRTYVDCSQIFKCDRELLETLVDAECEYYQKTQTLKNEDVEDILNLMYEAISEVPPYLSIMEVKLDENGNTYGKSLYLSDTKIDEIFNIANSLPFDLEEEYEDKLLSSYSSKDSERLRIRSRYQNGIDFCEMFLNEYFPKKVNEFKKMQGLNKNNKLDNENTPSL